MDVFSHNTLPPAALVLAGGKLGSNKLKTPFQHFRLLIVVFGLGTCFATPVIAEEEGVAVGIVYDTSGSMGGLVADGNGVSAPKHAIAKRALVNVLSRLEAYANSGAPGALRTLKVGLYSFRKQGAREVAPLGIFDARSTKVWPDLLPAPGGGTPLGLALETAGKAVLRSGLRRQHVLVITDGENTVGPDPVEIVRVLTDQAVRQDSRIFVHFIAFDVDAKVFAPLKKAGATVVTAANETQLNGQLSFILGTKILLEDEEPAPAPKTN